MNRIFARLGITALTLVAGPCLVAQTSSTGAVSGIVLDALGAPLAGVRVTFSSRQIARETTTDQDGRYHLGLLNPGPWTLEAGKAGFSKAQRSLQLSVNAMATANFKLAKEGAPAPKLAGESAPKLAGESAGGYTSTALGETFKMAHLEAVPLGRDVTAVAQLAAGVSAAPGGGLAIAGGSGGENSFSIDGLRSNNYRTGGQAASMVPEFVDQLQVLTGGFNGGDNATGGVVNIVTRSGANDYAGSAWVNLTPGALQPGPKANGFFAEAKPATVYEIGSWAGGAAIKDKLFYSVGVDFQQASAPSYSNLSDLPVASSSTPSQQLLGKLNYYLTPDDQFTFSYFSNSQKATQGAGNTPGNAFAGRGTANYGGSTQDTAASYSLAYDTILSPTLTLALKAGQSRNEHQVSYLDGGAQTFNPATLWASGGAGSAGLDQLNLNNQFSADFTNYQGYHTYQFGLAQTRSSTSLIGTNTDALYQTLYVQDTWQQDRDLAFIYGVRTEHETLKDSNGQRFLDFGFGKLQPRLGFVWDVNGDGRSKLSGNYAWYCGEILNPGSANQGSFAGDPTTPVAERNIKLPRRTEWQLGFDRQLSASTTLGFHGHYRKLTNPIEESVITLANGHGIDPSLPAGQPILWNPGSAATWISPVSGQVVSTNNSQFPQAYNSYSALDVTYQRRTAENLLGCSYTWSRSGGSYPGLGLGGADSYANYPYVGRGLTPLDHTNQLKAYGYQRFQLGHDVVSVGFNFVLQSGSPYSQLDNGLSTYGLNPNGSIKGDPGGYGNATYVNGLMGHGGRTPSTSSLDFNLRYERQLSARFKLEPSLEVFNLLNDRPTTQVVEQSTDASGNPLPAGQYGSATQYQPGRSFRFGAKLVF